MKDLKREIWTRFNGWCLLHTLFPAIPKPATPISELKIANRKAGPACTLSSSLFVKLFATSPTPDTETLKPCSYLVDPQKLVHVQTLNP